MLLKISERQMRSSGLNHGNPLQRGVSINKLLATIKLCKIVFTTVGLFSLFLLKSSELLIVVSLHIKMHFSCLTITC